MTVKGRGKRPSPPPVSQSKLDRVKARLPEPQNQVDCMWSGEHDGDTHSLLNAGDSMAHLRSHGGGHNPNNGTTVRTGHLPRAHLPEG